MQELIRLYKCLDLQFTQICKPFSNDQSISKKSEKGTLPHLRAFDTMKTVDSCVSCVAFAGQGTAIRSALAPSGRSSSSLSSDLHQDASSGSRLISLWLTLGIFDIMVKLGYRNNWRVSCFKLTKAGASCDTFRLIHIFGILGIFRLSMF